MSVEGVNKLTRVQLAQLNVDMTKSTPEIRTLIALIDPVSGLTAFMKQNGSVWSSETRDALRSLIDCLERDAARTVLTGASDMPSRQAAAKAPDGLGEYLSSDVPDI